MQLPQKFTDKIFKNIPPKETAMIKRWSNWLHNFSRGIIYFAMSLYYFNFMADKFGSDKVIIILLLIIVMSNTIKPVEFVK